MEVVLSVLCSAGTAGATTTLPDLLSEYIASWRRRNGLERFLGKIKCVFICSRRQVPSLLPVPTGPTAASEQRLQLSVIARHYLEGRIYVVVKDPLHALLSRRAFLARARSVALRPDAFSPWDFRTRLRALAVGPRRRRPAVCPPMAGT